MFSNFLHLKINVLKNMFLSLKKEPPIKLGLISFAIISFLIGGYLLFLRGFIYLQSIPGVGDFLIERLLGVFFMTLFLMLIFSNVIVSFSTLYSSDEVNFLMGLPVTYRGIFSLRFIETLIYSSWAFVFLSIPLLLSFGTIMHARWYFYLFVSPVIITFLIIPSGLGSIITMVLARVIPLKKGVVLLTAFLVVLVPTFVFFSRLLHIGRGLESTDTFGLINQILRGLRFSYSPILPSYWLTQGILAFVKNNLKGGIFYFLVLLSNSLLICRICIFMAHKIYYPGWAVFKSSNISRRYPAGSGVLRILNPLFRLLNPQIRALIIKDIKVFMRDPAQWVQWTIFFGLLAIYISNLRNLSYDVAPEASKVLISFLNLVATGFVLSSLTTRFVFPLFSLEGKRFWSVGLAPISINLIMMEKFWLSTIACLVITESLMFFSNFMLRASPLIHIITCGTVFLMSFSLSGLSAGLGTIYPNFKEDNPARIVSGLGGTLNIILSMIYIGIVIAIEALPLHFYMQGEAGKFINRQDMIVFLLSVFVLSLITVLVPLKLGSRVLKDMEF